jgi:hypothetical protein
MKCKKNLQRLGVILFCVAGVCQTGEAMARIYRIRQGDHFAIGTFRANEWFIGKKLRFQAKFDPSNVYTLPPGDQADSNKLFGFSDCGRYAGNSSARIGWRWFRNRLEITAVAHYDGNWHLYEILGVADLRQIHDFEIELSPDRAHYRFRFDHGPAVEMRRDCDSPYMWGYVLYPYFGGNLAAPHDMELSVWSESRAGIALLEAGPNPVPPDRQIKTRILVPEPIEARYEIYSTAGALEWTSPVRSHPGSPSGTPPDLQDDSFTFPPHLPTGVHLLRLSARTPTGWRPGFVLDGEELVRLLVLP